MGAGIAQCGGAGPAVVQGEGHAPLGQGGPGVLKSVELVLGIGLAAVGVGEVGEHAPRPQAGQGAQGGNVVGHGAVVPVQLPQKADAAHARVQLHVDVQHAPGPLGGLGQSAARVQIAHRLGHVIAQQGLRLLHGGIAQAEDGQGDTRLTQLGRLGHTGHGQHVTAQLLQLFGDGHGPVAIGVGLDQPQELAALRGQGAQGAVVVGQGVQVHFGPGPDLCEILHSDPS